MIYWLTYDAFVPMLTGVFLSGLFAILFFNTREKLLLYVALVIAVLTIATVTCEHLIVTDQEKVESLLNDISKHVANNDVNTLLTHFSANHAETRQRAIGDMSEVTFSRCSVIGTNYFEGPTTGDPNAEICFAVSATGSFRHISNETGRFKVTVNFEKRGDAWKITNYKYDLPMAGLRQ